MLTWISKTQNIINSIVQIVVLMLYYYNNADLIFTIRYPNAHVDIIKRICGLAKSFRYSEPL